MSRVFFLGDVAVNSRVDNTPLQRPSMLDNAELVLLNLEGPILTDPIPDNWFVRRTTFVYNRADTLSLLSEWQVDAVWLANNHIFDLPIPLQQTTSALAQRGIMAFGAGANLAEASQPFVCDFDDGVLKVFAFGWDVIGCKPATTTRPGVNPMSPEWMFQTIRKLRAQDKESCVVFVMHWNYELERYPQPAHRQLAHTLIAEGVDAIVGLHPHIVQGAEFIDGKPIVYSLGNWFFPPTQIGNFRLSFPPVAQRELALELVISGRVVENVLFHWFQFDFQRLIIRHERTEDRQGEIVRQLSPFVGTSHEAYGRWFRRNRARRRGLPVYYDYRHKTRNVLKDKYVKARQQFISALVQRGLKRKVNG